jgi:hypothetical protein
LIHVYAVQVKRETMKEKEEEIERERKRKGSDEKVDKEVKEK